MKRKNYDQVRQPGEEPLMHAAAALTKIKGPSTQRVYFDPLNEDHLKDYANFVEKNNWTNGCQYVLEQPFEDIPSMINDKLIKHFLRDYLNK